MLPKNSLLRIKDVAKKMDVEEGAVKDAVSFFYDSLRKNLSDLSHFRIRVDSLGTFVLKEKELEKVIGKHKDHLNFLETGSFKRMRVKVKVEEDLRKALNVLDLLFKEKQRRIKFKEGKQNVQNTE